MAATAWSKGSVKDVAESIGIGNLTDDISSALAADVEYRLREVIEESLKFMRHGRRTRLKVEDVDYALKVRNIEPLWGFSSPHAPIAFRKAPHASGNLYYVEDEEIDLSKLSQQELPPIPRDISYTAHWLAVEGVQPAIPQNPSPAEVRLAAANARSGLRTAAAGPEGTEIQPLVAHALSKELQLYFDRLTTSALDPDETTRLAALESFRGDTGLQGLVAYLVQWTAEKVVTCLNSSLLALDQCLDVMEAMLQNSSLFVEPYLHQLLPSILSILLTSSLGSSSSAQQQQQLQQGFSPQATRQHAASFLSFLLSRYASTYSSLKPRILQTLLRGLVNGCLPDPRNSGTLLGALLGIRALGRDTVRRVFGARSTNLGKVGEALQRETFQEQDRDLCIATVLDSLQEAYPASAHVATFDYSELESYAGHFFAAHINARCAPSVARGIVAEPAEELADAPATEDRLPNGHAADAAENGARPDFSRRESMAGSTGGGESQDAEGSGDDEDSEDVEMDSVNA